MVNLLMVRRHFFVSVSPVIAFVTSFALLGVCTAQTGKSNPVNSKPSVAASTQESDPVLVGAGDIATCGQLDGAEATAKLLDQIPGAVFAVGDLAYPGGSEENFAKCYDPRWGRHSARTRTAPGNHEYHIGGAPAYSHYFVAAARDPHTAYYHAHPWKWHATRFN